jgi:hypothetical protein
MHRYGLIILSSFLFSQEILATHIIHEAYDSKRYVHQQAEDLYFIAEVVNSSNQNSWVEYANTQLNALEEEKAKFCNGDSKYSEELLDGMSDGLTNFHASLSKYFNTDPGSVSYVVFALSSKDSSPEDFYSRIEMAYCITATVNGPFSTHMGISRSFTYSKASEEMPLQYPLHKRIAILLHAFGAYFTSLQHPNVSKMITSPLPTMGNFIIDSLPKESVWLGDIEWIKKYNDKERQICRPGNHYERVILSEYIDSIYPKAAELIKFHNDWSPINQSGGLYNESPYARECNCTELSCMHVEVNPNFSWVLQDKERRTLLHLTPDEIKIEYRWFFEANYLTDVTKFPYVTAELKALCDQWTAQLTK